MRTGRGLQQGEDNSSSSCDSLQIPTHQSLKNIPLSPPPQPEPQPKLQTDRQTEPQPGSPPQAQRLSPSQSCRSVSTGSETALSSEAPLSAPQSLPQSPSRAGSRRGRGGFRFQGLVEIARRLRQEQTPAEEVFWEIVRNRRLAGLKFRRQHQIGPFIVDFYCAQFGLIIELDGTVHDLSPRKKKDAKRDAYLVSLGNTIQRFPNNRVLEDTWNVLKEILVIQDRLSRRDSDAESRLR